MRLLFKQRFFSWFDSYDIYDEEENTIYTVKGQLSWGHCLKIFDPTGNEIGTVREKILTFLPKFELYLGDQYIGCISKELTFFKPRYNIDCNGWGGGGKLSGMGLLHCGRFRNSRGCYFQRDLSLDRHLRDPGIPAGGRSLRPYADAGH